jgi:hypothetical protein
MTAVAYIKPSERYGTEGQEWLDLRCPTHTEKVGGGCKGRHLRDVRIKALQASIGCDCQVRIVAGSAPDQPVTTTRRSVASTPAPSRPTTTPMRASRPEKQSPVGHSFRPSVNWQGIEIPSRAYKTPRVFP